MRVQESRLLAKVSFIATTCPPQESRRPSTFQPSVPATSTSQSLLFGFSLCSLGQILNGHEPRNEDIISRSLLTDTVDRGEFAPLRHCRKLKIHGPFPEAPFLSGLEGKAARDFHTSFTLFHSAYMSHRIGAASFCLIPNFRQEIYHRNRGLCGLKISGSRGR